VTSEKNNELKLKIKITRKIPQLSLQYLLGLRRTQSYLSFLFAHCGVMYKM